MNQLYAQCKTGHEMEYSHEGKSRKQKVPSTKGINGINRGKRKNEVDRAESKRGEQGLNLAEVCFGEYVRLKRIRRKHTNNIAYFDQTE